MRVKRVTLPLILAVALTFSACGVDEVISALKVGDSAAQAIIPLVSASNPALATKFQKVDSGVQLVVKAYQDYESAAGSDKPSKAEAVKAAVSAVQANLSDILDALGVKDSETREYVTVAVSVINTALVGVLAILPSSGTQAHAAQVSRLPVVEGAKSAQALKDKWNNTVKTAHPASQI